MRTFIEQAVLGGEQLLLALNMALTALLACGLGLASFRLCRRRPAPLRYGLLLAALVLVVFSPALSGSAQWAGLGWLRVSTDAPLRVDNPPIELPPETSDAAAPWLEAVPEPIEPVTGASVMPAELSPWPAVSWWRAIGTLLAAAWSAGVVVGLARLAWGFRQAVRFRRTLARHAGQSAIESLGRASRLLALRRLPALATSPLTPAPLVLGLLRPAIVLPHGLDEELTGEQLDAVLLHEAAHVAHHDVWVALLQRLAGVLFWWCLPLHWLSRRLTDLREQICDNYVLRTQGDGFGFAQVLVDLAERVARFSQPRLVGALGIVEPASDGLEGRVVRLLQQEANTMTRMNLTALVATVMFGLAVGTVTLAMNVRAADKESPKPPTVAEVAGLKKHGLDSHGIEATFPSYEKIIIGSHDPEVVDFAIEGARTHLDNRLNMGEHQSTLGVTTGLKKSALRPSEIARIQSFFDCALANRAKWRDTTPVFLSDIARLLNEGGQSDVSKRLQAELGAMESVTSRKTMELTTGGAYLAVQVPDESGRIFRSGTYKSGDWEYVYYRQLGRNPVVKGKLIHKGKELAVPEGKQQPVQTPWGAMTWRGIGRSHGWSGWLLEEDRRDASATQPAAKVVVKDGLSVIATPPKATFAADEPIQFTVQFKNVSDKPFMLYEAEYFLGWRICFENRRAKEQWLFRKTIKDRREVPVPKTLKPGESMDVPVRLDRNGDFRLQDPQAKADAVELSLLPVGRYVMTVEVDLKGSPAPGKWEFPFWTGPITSQSVEMEIVLPDGPGAHLATLSGGTIPQVDHNAIVDRAKYNMVLEVVDAKDKFTRYAVKINDVSRQFIATDKGAKPVWMTGTVDEVDGLKVITPTQIERQPLPIESSDRSGRAANPAPRQAVYAKVILPVDKPVTSEYPLEPWIEKDLATRGKADFAAMSDWTDSRYPQWVPNTAEGKANFAAVSDWTRVDEKPAGAHPTMIWFGGQLACPARARYGARTADGHLTIELSGFSPGDARGLGSLPPKPGSRTVVEVTWGNRKCYVALHVGPPPAPAGSRRSGVTLDLASRSTRWPLPGRSETKTLDELLLRVTNRTGDDIWFAQAADLKVIVKDAKGKVLPDMGGQKGEIVPSPLFIKTWAPGIVRFTVTLQRPGDGKSATLTIREPTAVFHEFQNLAPGAYTIQVLYANREAKLGTMIRGIKNRADPWGRPLDEDTPLWVGKATANELTVQITDEPAAPIGMPPSAARPAEKLAEAPGGERTAALDKAKLIEIANEEAKKAYRKQRGLAADARVPDFDYDRKPTGAVHHNLVEPEGDNWRVILMSTLTVNGVTKILFHVEVPLNQVGKVAGEVKFKDTDEPSAKGVFSGLAYYRAGDEFLVGMGYSTPRPVERVEFDKQRLDYLGPAGNHVKFRVKAPGFAEFKVRFRDGSSEGTADILPPPEKDDEPRPANSKVTQWLGADGIRILARGQAVQYCQIDPKDNQISPQEMIGHGPQMKPRICNYRIIRAADQSGDDAVRKVRDLLFDAQTFDGCPDNPSDFEPTAAIRVKRLGKEAILLIDFDRELMRVTGMDYLTGGKKQYTVTLSIAPSTTRWRTLADDSLKRAQK